MIRSAFKRRGGKLIPTLLKLSMPLMGIEINLDDLADSGTVDERLVKLDKVKTDLQAAIGAVEELQAEGIQRRDEIIELQKVVVRLEADKTAAEKMLEIPEESLTRLISKATSQGRFRGRVEGALVGFTTSFAAGVLLLLVT